MKRDYKHLRKEGRHLCSANFVYVGKGDTENPLEFFWGYQNLYRYDETDNHVLYSGYCGNNLRVDYFVLASVWSEKIK